MNMTANSVWPTKRWTLEQLLPHRSPMLLLDEVMHAEHDRVDVLVAIHDHCAFYDESRYGVPAWVGVEYMAQAIGVWEGFRKLTAGEVVGSAFLLGVRDFRVDGDSDTFRLGDRLTIRVSPVMYDEEKRLGVFDCTITGQDILCRARINAFSPLEPMKFLEVLRRS